MKLAVQRIIEATPIIAQIINDKRPMSQKGKYRLARMHAKLLPEFTMAMAQRDELIKSYDTPADNGLFKVPDDKLAEFAKSWTQILNECIHIDIQPLPLELIDLGDAVNGSIEAVEIAALGELLA